MARTREYASTITVTADQLAQMRSAQRVVYRNGGFDTNHPDWNGLVTGLTGFGATILGLVFIASTPVGIAMGVTSIVASLFAIGKTGEALESLIKQGNDGMADGLEFFELNKRYDMLEIKFPFLEYSLSDGTVIRFVTGAGVPVRAHVAGSGWEIF